MGQLTFIERGPRLCAQYAGKKDAGDQREEQGRGMEQRAGHGGQPDVVCGGVFHARQIAY